MNTSQALAECMDVMTFSPTVRKATVFLSPHLVVSMCRRHKFSKRSRLDDFVVKVGAPNYLEREFIKSCKKVGVKLPVHRPQLKFWPQKRKIEKNAS